MRIPGSIATKFVLAIALPAAAMAQIGLPPLSPVDLGRTLGDVTGMARLDALPTAEAARSLAETRIARLADFASRNRSAVDLDSDRNPVVRDVLIATGIDNDAISRAEFSGFRVIGREEIEGLGFSFVRFAIPQEQGLKAAQKKLTKIAGNAEIGVDHIYFSSGAAPMAAKTAMLAPSGNVTKPAIGMIDGGVAASPSIGGTIEQRGFAEGAPLPSTHGTAIASLIIGRGAMRGAAPDAQMLAADVYGRAPAGGSATAIARALGWMTARHVPVVTISLVGPDNPLLRTAIRAAQGKGVLIVAAVGNDGPAAPPSYPASLPGVLAVTGTDTRERALPEAGRALHVDFSAPGTNMMGAAPSDGLVPLRGTSFAAPLVAARLSSHYPRPSLAEITAAVGALVAEAKDLGKKGRDPVYGHGLVCGNCATR